MNLPSVAIIGLLADLQRKRVGHGTLEAALAFLGGWGVMGWVSSTARL